MHQLVYVSSAVRPFHDAQLTELLDTSRRLNEACHVTGLLLYVRGNFIQLLEGAQADVVATFARIQKDPRHRGLITLMDGACEKRDFPSWSMGFEKVEGSTAEQLPGYSDFLSTGADKDVQSSAALRLLEFFRELNR